VVEVGVELFGWQADKQATAPTNAIIERMLYFPYYYSNSYVNRGRINNACSHSSDL
jgi:hypothetical protein